MAKGRDELPALTSLRFVAALAVVAHHIAGFRPGYGGVSFFFVLSGYILARKYGDRVSTPDQRIAFWSRRLRRIYPAHFATALLAIPLAIPTLGTLTLNLALLHAWVPDPDSYFALNSVSWSLSVEVFCYAMFPLLASITIRPAIAWLVCVAALAIAAEVWGVSDAAVHDAFYINPAFRLVEFAIGIALANAQRLPIISERQAICAAGATAAVAWAVPTGALTQGVIFVPAVVMAIVAFREGEGLIGRMLCRPEAVLVGEASFLFFLFAQIASRYGALWFGPSHLTNVSAACGALITAIAVHCRVWRAWAQPRVRLRYLP